MFELNYVPQMKGNESFRGYIERVNIENGFKGAQDLCKNLGVSYIPISRPYSAHYIEMVKLIEVGTRQISGQLLNVLNNHWLKNYLKRKIVNDVHLYHRNFRYCPKCIQDSPHMLADWDFPLVTECKIHNCSLLEKCPKCHSRLYWNQKKLLTCSSCKARLTDCEDVDSGIPELIDLSAKVTSSSYIDYVNNVILACRRAFRLEDNLLSMPPLEKMSLEDLRALILNALGLLHSTNFRTAYFRYLKQEKVACIDISIDACLEPWLVFRESCTNFEFDNTLPDLSFPIQNQRDDYLGITPKRLKTNNQNSVEELSHQIDAVRLVKIFGLHLSYIEDALDNGLLKPLTQVKTTRHSLFDLKDISEKLSQLEVHTTCPPSDAIKLGDIYGFLAKFNANFANVIEFLFTKKITVYCSGKHKQLAHCTVSQNELFHVLHNKMLTHTLPFSAEDLIAILFTNETLLRKLEKKEIIFSNHWSKEFELSSDRFIDFINGYISIERVSFFSGLSVASIQEKLESHGIRLVFDEYFRGASIKLIVANTYNHDCIRNLINSNKTVYLGYAAPI